MRFNIETTKTGLTELDMDGQGDLILSRRNDHVLWIGPGFMEHFDETLVHNFHFYGSYGNFKSKWRQTVVALRFIWAKKKEGR